ncbi:TPA: hypothetical protein ACGO2R_000502 [Streptococcus suis]
MSRGYQDIQCMRVWIGGYFGPINSVEMDFEDEEVIYTHIDDHDSRSELELSFSASQFKHDLENCRLLEWDEEYVNPYVLDGTQWYVDILFKRNAPLRIEGSNAYPKTFDQLCSAISEIIQADFI